jgi:hypothetical protein
VGDRCYTRFSIPLTALATAKRRRATAAALGLSAEEITAICAENPAANTPAADYSNDTHLRFVDGVPCLVWEDDEANFGGALIEDELCASRIPLLRFHLVGDEYGPGRAAYTGRGQLQWIDCDSDKNPLIRVDVRDGTAVIDPDAVNRLLAAERAVLRCARPQHSKPTPRSRKKKRS